jgi:CubicO group peptidase (beta-lactamase class C family)
MPRRSDIRGFAYDVPVGGPMEGEMHTKPAARNLLRVLALTLIFHLLTATAQAQVKPFPQQGPPTIIPPTLQLAVTPDKGAVKTIDDAVTDIMYGNGITGASLAIIHNQRLIYAQGYTITYSVAPAISPISPTTYFRQASVSKLITALAVMQLIQEGKLALNTTMQSVLKLQTPDSQPPVHPNFSAITIQHLLEMSSGLDPTLPFSDQAIANALGKALPVTPADILTYAAGQQLGSFPYTRADGATVYLRPPGNKSVVNYNNTDYFVLGQIVAKLRGASSLADAIQGPLLDPLNIKGGVRSAQSIQQQPDEATYDGGGLTAANVMGSGPARVPVGYGDFNLENSGGAGGLSATAVAMARVLAAMNISARNVNERNPIFKHGVYPNLVGNMLGYAYGAYHDPLFSFQDPNGGGAHGMYGLDGFGHRTPKNAPLYFFGLKGGQLSASQNAVYFIEAGFGYVISWNSGRVPADGWYPTFPKLLAAAAQHDWGSNDLFPNYGMPSFPGATSPVATLDIPELSPAQSRARPPSAFKWTGAK